MFQPSQDDLTTNGGRQSALHERAAAATWANFGPQVFVRAVVEGLPPLPVGFTEHLERWWSPQARATVAG